MPDPTLSNRPIRGHERVHDCDELIDAIVECARDWAAEGVDLAPDGVHQLRGYIYRLFGLQPPAGDVEP